MNKKHLMTICMALILIFSAVACGTIAPAEETSNGSVVEQETVENTESTEAVEEQEESAGEEKKEEKYISFDSETVYSDPITKEVFADNDITLVNIFATWCGPCVEEIPYLQEIDVELENVGVVGIVADTYDAESGEQQQEAIDTAKEIAEKTGAKYPFVIPDADFMEDNLSKIAAIYPMSYLVDKDGKVVDGPIGGAHSKEKWIGLIQEALGDKE